jgi:hypothetical protein
MLDLAKLENVRRRGGKIEARCPACAEMGADRAGNHLIIAEGGKFGCIVATGSEGAEHRKRIFQLAGTASTAPKARPVAIKRIPAKPKASPRIPPLRPLNVAELAAVRHLRGWCSFAGLELLTQRGLLWHGDVFDANREWPAWIITDATRRNAQARRLDGRDWQGISAKAKTLPNCDPSWPIGAAEMVPGELVLICEGQPDFCAALLVAWWEGVSVSPVCMTGAGNPIHADALPCFTGKHVRIATHDDDQGRAASVRWAAQLYEAGAATVDRINFHGMTKANGEPVKDLADYATRFDPELPAPPPVLSARSPCTGTGAPPPPPALRKHSSSNAERGCAGPNATRGADF